MAEFMQSAVAQPKRLRKASTVAGEAEAELLAPNTADARSDAELAAIAVQLTHVPRNEWPAEVLDYQRRMDRARKRSVAAALEQADRLRREVEQARRDEQLGNNNDDDDDGDAQQPREGARYAKRTKRARIASDRELARIPNDLMSDEEIAAARVAPLVPPDDATKQRIVERVRFALSDAQQGERVCAVCDEIVLKSPHHSPGMCLLLRLRTAS